MLNWIIDFSLRRRFLVILGSAVLAAVGIFSLFHLDIDAFPDTTPVEVQINTVAPALGPIEVERQITAPIEQSLAGLPRLELLRSVSKFGLSQVVATFAEGTDVYFARQQITEHLGSARLPPEFGLVVDSSVVLVENCVRRLAHDCGGRSRREVIRVAAVEVRQPTLFGELIILIVYLPILTLEGIEGKLFRPMALTVIFALLGSMLFSLTLMPALASLVLPRRLAEREPLLIRAARAVYLPCLRVTMRNPSAVLAFAVLSLAVTFGLVAPNLGSEFVPRLSEGAIALNIVRPAGTDLAELVRYNTALEQAVLAAFPDEVAHVWSRAGTAEVATDPMGVELTDVYMSLRPRSRWKRATDQAELTELVQKELRQLPGQKMAFSQPIELRINEMVSGVRTDVAVKVFGDDLKAMLERAGKVREALEGVPGVADLAVEQVTGQPVLEVKIRQDQLACYDIPARAVLDVVAAIGGQHVGEVADGPYRFPLAVKLDHRAAAGPEALSAVLLPTKSGEEVPLGRVADVDVIEGPSTISREWGQRRVVVTCNVRGRDLGGFVEEARRKVAREVPLPPGGRDRITFGGQFEQLQRARTRLLIVVPVALLSIFGLLYATYGNWADALRVFTGVPFAWVGGRAGALAPRHALLDLRGGGLHRPFGRGGARRHDPRFRRAESGGGGHIHA